MNPGMLICFFSVVEPAVSIAFTLCLQSYCICIIRSHCYEGELSGSVVESSTRDQRAAGSSLTSITALWSLSKTHLS